MEVISGLRTTIGHLIKEVKYYYLCFLARKIVCQLPAYFSNHVISMVYDLPCISREPIHITVSCQCALHMWTLYDDKAVLTKVYS